MTDVITWLVPVSRPLAQTTAALSFPKIGFNASVVARICWAGTAMSTMSRLAASAMSVVAFSRGSSAMPGSRFSLRWPVLIPATTSASRAHSTTSRPASACDWASAVPQAPPPMTPIVWSFFLAMARPCLWLGAIGNGSRISLSSG